MKMTVLAAMAMVMAAGAYAQNVDFDALVSRVVDSNTSIKSMVLESKADSLALRSENALQAPEVSFESLFGRDGDKKYNVEVNQGFDWPGLYSARGQASRASARLAASEIEVARAEARAEASSLLLAAINAKAKVADYESLCADFERMLALYDDNYRKGNVSILDLNKLRVETAAFRLALDVCRRDLAQNLAQLNALAAAEAEITVEMLPDNYPIYQQLDFEQYKNRMLSSAPKLRAAEARVELSRAESSVAARSSLLGFSLGYRYAYEERQPYNGFAVGLSLPFWGANGRRGAADASRLAADFKLQAEQQAMIKQLRADYDEAASLRESITLYGQALEASDNLGLLRKAFDAGHISLTSYLQDVSYFVEARAAYRDLQCRLTQLMTKLSRY